MVILLLACLNAPTEPAEAPIPVPADAVEAPVMEAPAAEAPPEDAPPAGRVGGEPILDRPVVLGGISTEDVERTLAATDTQSCHQSGLGKVLVSITITKTGAVANSETVSSSLRQPQVEDCLNERVRAAKFPALVVGDKALVKYTFAF